MKKRKWLWICCMILLLSLPLQPVMASEENTWHALPASGQGGAYICGRYQLVNCVNRDGVLYVNMGLFGMMISDVMPDIDWGTGVVRYHIRNAETEAEQSSLTISVQGDTVDISFDGNIVVWQHQPYWRENKGEGVLPDLMLPLRDICQTLDMEVRYQNGVIFVGYMQQPLVLPSAEIISSLQTKMDILVTTVSENSYSLAINNGQVIVESDTLIPIWQTPNNQEGALFLDVPEDEKQVISVQELQHDGTLKTKYTLPGEPSYRWQSVTRMETMAGPALATECINTAQSHFRGYYLIQPDGSLHTVLEGNIIDFATMTKNRIYYIQYRLFGEKNQLISVPLYQDEESSSELDREDMSYRAIELVDENHLLVHIGIKQEEACNLYLVDLSSKQYQPITDQNWVAYVLAGSWIYGLNAEDQCIYRFRTDGSEITRVTGKAQYFGKAVFDNTAVTYIDEKKCLWVVGDQNIQLTTVPVEQWQAVGDQIFYRISGATAGIYVYDRQSGQQKCLLTGEYKDMAVSDTEQVVVLPFVGESIALYQDGAWQKISLGE